MFRCILMITDGLLDGDNWWNFTTISDEAVYEYNWWGVLWQ